MRRAIVLFSAALLAGAVQLAARGAGAVPPLGPLLDPANGVWSSAASVELARPTQARIPGLGQPVQVIFDDRGVPHIFAANTSDAHRALGYVVARDRLFQLELQARAGAGRLTEMVGERALSADRFVRSTGLHTTAERKLAALDSSSPGWQAITAFAEGVNAYVEALRPRELPVEYRLLGTSPARWEPVNSIHLLNRMAMTLSFNPTELTRLRSAARVGWEATDALFPYHSPIQEPIEPSGRNTPRLDFRPIPPAGSGDPAADETVRLIETAMGEPPAPAAAVEPGTLGSNSWAVSPRRSASGHALLAGDPHLELNLPPIWYEVHLAVPDTVDVYGVTIPGAPWVVIGFNRDIAWTFTNNDVDVVDFYTETVNDPRNPTSYLLDGEWRTIERTIEHYRGAGGRVLATDTLRFTHRGPMRRAGDRWLSMRWTAHEPWADEHVFPGIARARSVDEFLDVTSAWVVPSQNMLVADRHGSIAVRSNGLHPIRPGGSRGDILHDGSTRGSDWTGFRPLEEYPFAKDPAQGFLATANQQPVDPKVRDEYMGSVWPAPWRAKRINALLRADSAVTTDAMRRYQTDPGSARAEWFVPYFLAAAQGAVRSGNDSARIAAALLADWDMRYTMENERAVLFETAMTELSRRTWDELIPEGGGQLVANPGDVMLAVLLEEPESPWWNDRRTQRRETRDDILVASLTAALARTVKRHGAPESGGWRWDRVRHANIRHLLQLPDYSASQIPVRGGPGLLNPSAGTGTHGASWRMVVELGPELRAWATFPGGQSGHPMSRRYRDRIPQWSAGELDELLVPRSASDLPPERVEQTLQLFGSAPAP